jgi:ubiquinol-cytochrome c reductase cytochrome b/c1 subunit
MANGGSGSKIVKWVDARLPIFSFVDHALREYPTPKNLSYWWNFGSLAGVVLVVMIVTGIVLAMHYTPHTTMAFDSVERIMRDVNYGWLIRYIHMNGASMFFIVVYIHIFRGMYYGSYKNPRELLWWLGVIIYLLMMALFSAIPWVGEAITQWLWGGFSVSNPTLNRFFSLHYLLPFVIVGVAVFHVWALHTTKSNNPLGIDPRGPQDTIPFHPYYTVKDYFGIGVFFIFWACFVFFAPDFFGEADNYIPANPLSTPAHIVPEWYYLPFYAILRAVPDNFVGQWIGFGYIIVDAKLAGVISLAASILILFVLPWLDTSKVRSGRFRPVFKWFFWIFLLDVAILGVCGAHSPDEQVFSWFKDFSYLSLGRIVTAYYFIHFLIILPIVGKIEKPLPLPTSISEPVLKGGGAAGASATAQPMEKA